jgi:glutamate 5-kinase
MVALHEAGVELVLVSSGAVAAGMSRLGLDRTTQCHA